MGYESYEQLVAQHQLYEDTVRRVARDLHVELLDSSRLLQERGLEKYFTKVDFAHPTGLGHTVIAQDLAAFIQSHGLLSK
jgi:lysophospholipase L1-like esterase